MAHMNLSAVGKSITVQIDNNDWTSLTVNQQSVPLGGSITVDDCASFTGVYSYGSPAYPWSIMTFIDSGTCNSRIWVAVVQFKSVSGGCQVSGIVDYADESSTFNINQLVATLQATQPQISLPVLVSNAGTTIASAKPQLFSANGLTGTFVANTKSR